MTLFLYIQLKYNLFISVFSREDKIQQRIKRIFKIWEEREVYSSSFITELNVLLETKSKPDVLESTKILSDFDVGLIFQITL